jgi:Tfp pilus assembly protein PilF
MSVMQTSNRDSNGTSVKRASKWGNGKQECRKLSPFSRLLLIAAVGCGSLQTLGCASSLLMLTNSDDAIEKAFGTSTEDSENTGLTPQQSSLACLRTAYELDKQNHLYEAASLYERARTFNPKVKGVSRRLAVLYARMNQADKARMEFDRAIEETPNEADLYSDAGFFYLQNGDDEKAEALLDKAFKLDPNHAKSNMHLAMLRAKQERPDESLTLFKKVVGPAEAHANLGVLLAKQGKLEQARSHFEQAQQLDSEAEVPRAFLDYLANHSKSAVQ